MNEFGDNNERWGYKVLGNERTKNKESYENILIDEWLSISHNMNEWIRWWLSEKKK